MLKVFTYCTYVLYIKTYSIQSNHQSINASYQRTYGPPPQTSVDPHSRKIKARQVNPHERHTTVPAGLYVATHVKRPYVWYYCLYNTNCTVRYVHQWGNKNVSDVV